MDIWGPIITFLIGVMTLVVGICQFKNQQWGKIVSESRNRWINDFRDEISIIVATLKFVQSNYICLNINEIENKDLCHTKIEFARIVYEGEKAKARLLTKLNTDNPDNGIATYELDILLRKIVN